MTRPRVVIIGGGLAGLSTGCYALHNGWDALIVEHNQALGGVCTAWQRGDYVVDGCIHWLTGGAFSDLYRELHIVPPVETRALDSFFTYVDVPTGERIVVGRDLDRLAHDLRTLAPRSAAAIDALVEGARAFAEVHPPIELPAELATVRTRLHDLWELRHQLGTIFSFRKDVASWASHHVQDDTVRRLLRRLAPDDAPMFVALMILGYLERGWLSRPIGGTAPFRDALIARYRELGGEARLSTTVDQIVVDGGRARGVRLTDGTILDGAIVVSTASTPETVLRLLDGRFGAAAVQDRLAQWKLFEPIAQVTYGVAAPLADVPPTLLLDRIEPLAVGGVDNDHLYLRIFNEGPGFAPPGHSVVQALLRTDFDWWASRGDGYAAAKAEVAEALRARLAVHLPPMRDQVRMIDVATPLTYWRSARSWRGAYEGWRPTADTFLAHVDKTLPGLDDFYMAGQWVEPGGGVPTALVSGRQVVQIMCERTGRPFAPAGRGL
ncbi:MAG TPA: NAD(P)/FAD-dependent oxidoreductase [Kofleriaceae bacterium]|nr:NAD(P)/FAD-dependent oxidoreductase [Kofleriaceae bacterium]